MERVKNLKISAQKILLKKFKKKIKNSFKNPRSVIFRKTRKNLKYSSIDIVEKLFYLCSMAFRVVPKNLKKSTFYDL